MDYICPDINHLVACFTCGSQALPPYRLCESGHVGCRPCSAYLRTCLCTQRYVSNAHYVFDALVSALLLKCKYAAAFGGRGGDGETCDGRWFDVQQLRDHYRDGCTRNAYTCPLTGCGRADRIDTVVEHYEAEHDVRTPPPAEHSEHDEMVIRLPITSEDKEEVYKIFNGYFMFSTSAENGTEPDRSMKLTIRNINPTDPLQYTCCADAYENELLVRLTVTHTTSDEFELVRWLSATSGPAVFVFIFNTS